MSRKFKPHDYQEDAMRFLYKVRRSALWMPMGGGKTVTTLTALDNMSASTTSTPILVLAPLRVAKSTWPEEVGKWDHLSHLPSVSSPARRSSASVRWPKMPTYILHELRQPEVAA
jgi:hypothetical protein